jgi:hypothetical protein
MFVARTDEENELLRQIQARFGLGGSAEQPGKPVGELVPLSDSEFTTVRTAIIEQFAPLRNAYMRGMAVARDDEQREVLAELRSHIGHPYDG